MKEIEINLIKYLTCVFKKIFISLKFDPELVKIQHSKKTENSDFQCNSAFKINKKNTIEIANNIVALAKFNENISDIHVTYPGFINLTVSNVFISKLINKNIKFNKIINKTVFLDFGGANIAKVLHVGHLRSLLLGDFLQRIHKFYGYNVISDFHLGDWGNHIGIVIYELINNSKNSIITLKDLSNYYKVGYKKYLNNTNIMLKAKNITFLVQNDNKYYNEIWKKIVYISIKEFKKQVSFLNIKFDLWKAESSVKNIIKDMKESLMKTKIAILHENAVIVPLKNYTPLILLNSDKIFLYAATDLATIIDRNKKYKIDKILYVVDKRQKLHFQQLFETTKKIDYLSHLNLHHIPFGTLNYKDKKPLKSRLGDTASLKDIIIAVNNKIKEKFVNKDIKNKNNIIKDIVLSTIKYTILSNYNIKDIIFDINDCAQYEGKTGPYILYSAVRIKSILRKIEHQKYIIDDCILKPAVDQYEKKLHILVLELYVAIEHSYKECDPYHLCNYIYKLALSFNRFYSQNKIINLKNKETTYSRIALCKIIADHFKKVCYILNIDIPEYM